MLKLRQILSTDQFLALRKSMAQTLNCRMIRSSCEHLVDKIVRDSKQIHWWQRQHAMNAKIYDFSSELEAMKFCGDEPKALFQLKAFDFEWNMNYRFTIILVADSHTSRLNASILQLFSYFVHIRGVTAHDQKFTRRNIFDFVCKENTSRRVDLQWNC